MSPEARTVIEWLAEGPGRRLTVASVEGEVGFMVTTFWRVEPGGERVAADVSGNTSEELLRAGLIQADGPGSWKPSAKGYLEGCEARQGLKSVPPESRWCVFEKPSGDRCRSWTMRGQEFCYYHSRHQQPEAPPEVGDVYEKASPRATRYRRRRQKGETPGPIPLIEEMPATIPTTAPPANLARLPKTTEDPTPSADPCRRHGIRFCPSCQELAELDALAGRRLKAKLEEIRKERVPWTE